MSIFVKLFEAEFKELNKMSKAELKEELGLFRALWTWIDEETRAWLCHIRYPVAFVRRDYHRFRGLMGAPRFEIKEVDIDVEETNYDFFLKTRTTELKTVTIPINQLINYEFVHKEDVMPMDEEEVKEEEPVVLEELV